jgi:hypothetical protein
MALPYIERTVAAAVSGLNFVGAGISDSEQWVALGANSGTSYMLKRSAAGNYDTAVAISGATGQCLDITFANDIKAYGSIGSNFYRFDYTAPGGVDTWTATAIPVLGGQAVRGVSISPDGQHIACAFLTAFVVYDIASNSIIKNVAWTSGEDVKYSPDGKYVAVVDRFAGVSVYQRAGAVYTLMTIVGGSTPTKGSWQLSWHRNSKRFVASANSSGTGAYIYALTSSTDWTPTTLISTPASVAALYTYSGADLVNFSPVSTAAPHVFQDDVTSVTERLDFSVLAQPTGGCGAGASPKTGLGRTVVLAGVTSGARIFTAPLAFKQRTVTASLPAIEYYGVAVSPDGKYVACCPSTATTTVKILVRNDTTGDYDSMQTVTGLPLASSAIVDAVFGPNSDTLYVPVNDKVHRCTLVGGVWTYEKQFAVTHGGANGIDIDKDERILLIGAASGGATLWNVVSDTLVQNIAIADTIQDAKFSSDGRYAALACQSLGLRVYDRGTPLTDVFTSMPVTGGGAAVANWAVQFNEAGNRIISGSIFSGNASSGFTLDPTGTPTWVGQTLQAAHNSVGATYILGKYPFTTSNSSVVPDNWADPNFVADKNSLPAMATHASRAGRGTGNGSGVFAFARTSGSGGGVVIYTVDVPAPGTLDLAASFTMPIIGMLAELGAEASIDGEFTIALIGMDGILANANGDIVPALPQVFRAPAIALEAEMLTEETEFLPLAQIEFTYGAYSMLLNAGLYENAEIEFTYGAYSMEILEGIKAEIEFTYGAYALEAEMDSRNAAHIAWSYGAYSMEIEGFQPIGMMVNFTYGAYSIEIDADAQFGAALTFGYGAYGMELDADVSMPANIEFTYGAYDIVMTGTSPVATDIEFTYGAYDMSASMSQPNSIIFSYGAYSMAVVASTPVVLDARLTYGHYGMALTGTMIKEAEIKFSYGAYGMEVVGEVVSNNALTFMIIQP